MNLCQWPGCERDKRRGRGARYCAAHERVAEVRETRRKRRAAAVARRRGHDGPSGPFPEPEGERKLWESYRGVLREFGLK